MTRTVKGGPEDTSRTGGTEIPTKGLRYSKPGGMSRRVKRQPVAWDCPKCGRHNARYLARCYQCFEYRPKEET